MQTNERWFVWLFICSFDGLVWVFCLMAYQICRLFNAEAILEEQ